MSAVRICSSLLSEDIFDMNMSFFYFIGNFDEIPYEIKKPSGQDRTAAEREYVAEATHCCGESYKVGFSDCRQSPGICRDFYYEHCFSGIIKLSERRCFL